MKPLSEEATFLGHSDPDPSTVRNVTVDVYVWTTRKMVFEHQNEG